MVIEMVRGTIIPKIPPKKADLVALCKELDLNSEGTVKLLKSRLNQKLNPTSKLDPRSVDVSPSLAKHLNKHSKISGFKVSDGLVKALIVVDNDAKKIILVELKLLRGEVFAEVNVAVDFPVGVTDITKTQTNREGLTLLVSTSQLLVLTDTLQIMAAVDLDIPLVDLKAVDDKIFFLQKNQVWFENFENLKNGILSPILVAGNGQRLDKDGSGKSSSFDDVSSISNYQDTIIVGTETGKVKLISDVASIADFLEKTFKVGVEGLDSTRNLGREILMQICTVVDWLMNTSVNILRSL